MSEDPAAIRNRMRELRKTQDPTLARDAAASACAKILAQVDPAHWKGMTIALYNPTAEEMDTKALADAWKTHGARLFYPRIPDPNNRRLEFAEITAGPGTWVKGLYGINEPSEEHPPGPID